MHASASDPPARASIPSTAGDPAPAAARASASAAGETTSAPASAPTADVAGRPTQAADGRPVSATPEEAAAAAPGFPRSVQVLSGKPGIVPLCAQRESGVQHAHPSGEGVPLDPALYLVVAQA